MQFKKRVIHTIVAPIIISTASSALAVSGGALVYSQSALANDSAELEALRAQVQELDQKIKVLARKDEVGEEEAVAKKKETPIVRASQDGFGLNRLMAKMKSNSAQWLSWTTAIMTR